jgi:hypothetical protein
MGLDELEDLEEAWRQHPPTHAMLARIEVLLRWATGLPPLPSQSPAGAGVSSAPDSPEVLDAFMARANAAGVGG